MKEIIEKLKKQIAETEINFAKAFVNLTIPEASAIVEALEGDSNYEQLIDFAKWSKGAEWKDGTKQMFIRSDWKSYVGEYLKQYGVSNTPEPDTMDNWISVEDRLPESGECVLLYSVNSGVVEGAWLSEKNHFEQWRWNAIATNVTHWQPLPNPPKK